MSVHRKAKEIQRSKIVAQNVIKRRIDGSVLEQDLVQNQNCIKDIGNELSTVVRRPVGGRPRVTTSADDRYIAIVAKWNRRVTSTRVTSMVTTSFGYRTDLHIFKRGFLTAVRYRDEVLEPIVRLYAAAVGPTFVLMDDNARPHRANIVDGYLESERIASMAWPAYSPDFNPIENLWDAQGRAVSSRFPPPATLIEQETALQEEWRLLSTAVIDNLIKSMVRRCSKLCIQMRRDHIPY
ncbi:transposable element Tcb1 transposase [Trichonephila clavipes]|nr:transposable element Tcb1 transposase [Trichonephila clavipes]